MAGNPGDVAVSLLFTLFLMFVLARLLGRLVEGAGLPGVVGEIGAGIVLGPSALALVNPADAGYGIALESLAEIGIVVLLFSIGLETPLADLRRVGRAALETATLGVVVPLAAGTALLLALAYDWRAALFVGAAMVATSVGITARVIGDLDMTHTKTAKVILGAAVIDDVLGMLVLAVVGAVAGASSASAADIAVVVAEAVAFVLVTLALGPRLVARIAGEREVLEGKRVYDPRRDFLKPVHTREAALSLALAACLGLAAASSLFRLAPIIGAFMAGVAFADVEKRYELHEHLEPVRTLLVPFFFVLMGAKVSLGAFGADPSLVPLALALTALAAATKFYPCRVGARSLGRAPARAVGFGMIPRGEVGLIVAAIALNLGIITGALFSVVVFMALGTSLIGPPLLRRAVGAGQQEGLERRMEVARPHEWKPPGAP